MKLSMYCNGFDHIEVDNIDISTFSFYGSTEDYDTKDIRSYNSVSFVCDNAIEVAEKIKSTFKLNPEYSKPEDYITVRKEFEDYESDKRPRLIITFRSGIRGIANPPSFTLSS